MFFFSSSIPSLTPSEAHKRLESNTAILIDVRESFEFNAVHAKHAKNIPLSSLSEDTAKKLLTEGEVLVICQSGGRSSRAVEFLLTLGVQAVNIEGGTSAWKKAGLPTA